MYCRLDNQIDGGCLNRNIQSDERWGGSWRQKKDKVSRDSERTCQRLTIKALLGGNLVMVLLLCHSFCRVCSSWAPFCESDPVNLPLWAESVLVNSLRKRGQVLKQELHVIFRTTSFPARWRSVLRTMEVSDLSEKKNRCFQNAAVILPQVVKLS